MSDLIEASSVRCQTMMDGTLRVVIDVDPAHAQAAFALFGSPGNPLVVGRLVMEHERKPEMKGGELAKLAGMWCNDNYFREWVKSQSDLEPDAYIKETCGIDSKRELDHDEDAAWFFHGDIRKPYAAWLKANGKSA